MTGSGPPSPRADDLADTDPVNDLSDRLLKGRLYGKLFPSLATPATRLGRFTLLRELGRGGMGLVLAAYDEQLDRKVAIKLLHADTADDERARARLLREAQALARLSHPNVVQVHEAGVHDGRVYLVMEYVDGSTLRTWLLESAPRDPKVRWRTALQLLVAAGEGLAAAHEVGLTHRDFKPDNLLVGADGRIRVADFGLAGEAAVDEPGVEQFFRTQSGGDEPDTPKPLDRLTKTGVALGTPWYMPLEQLRGRGADARSDQFAFCVTLYEALYGGRPFEGRSWPAVQLALEELRIVPPPPGNPVPERLRRIVLRGLSTSPDGRWPSMNALLDELRAVLAPPRRRWLGAMAAGALLTVGIAGARLGADGSACDGARDKLARVWDAAQRQRVRDAIVGTELSFAADTWTRVETGLDEYANAWVAKHTDACEATHVRHEQSSEVMDLRMECLAERLDMLQSSVDALATPGAAGDATGPATRASNAIDLVAGLPSLSRCDDPDALRAAVRPPEDPEVAAAVEEQQQRLWQIETVETLGDYAAALVETEEVVRRAEQLGHPPLVAHAVFRRGSLREALSDFEGSQADFEQAYALAAEHGDEHLEMSASRRLVSLAAGKQVELERAAQWSITAVALSRGPHIDPIDEALTLNSSAVVLARSGDPEEARRRLERALEIFDEQDAPKLRYEATMNNLAQTIYLQGDLDAAVQMQRRALELAEEVYGPEHPETAITLRNLGGLYRAQGRYDEAIAQLERSRDLLEAAFGPEHSMVGSAIYSIGHAVKESGRPRDALPMFRRALEIHERALGPSHAEVAADLEAIGRVLQRQEQLDEGLDYLRRALDIQIEVHGQGHPRVAAILSMMALVLRKQGKREEALAAYRDVLAMRKKALGARHYRVADTMHDIGIMLREGGERDEALALHEDALEIQRESLGPDHPDLGKAYGFIARVHFDRGDPKAAASELEKALALEERTLGLHHPQTVDSHIGLTEISMQAGDMEAARRWAERALTLAAEADLSPVMLAELRFAAARAYGSDPKRRDEARALAEAARDTWASTAGERADRLAEADAWLAEHGG